MKPPKRRVLFAPSFKKCQIIFRRTDTSFHATSSRWRSTYCMRSFQGLTKTGELWPVARGGIRHRKGRPRSALAVSAQQTGPIGRDSIIVEDVFFSLTALESGAQQRNGWKFGITWWHRAATPVPSSVKLKLFLGVARGLCSRTSRLNRLVQENLTDYVQL